MRGSGATLPCHVVQAFGGRQPSAAHCPASVCLPPPPTSHMRSMAKYPLVVQSDCTVDVKTEVVDICVTAV